ncbi:MAG: secretion protein [Myxococcota bacterium]
MTASYARVAAVGVCALLLVGCETAVEGGLPEAQANRVLVALHEAGIGARKEPEGGRGEPTFAVHVPSDDVARALEVLRAEGLPKPADPGFHEVFGEGSLVPTATEERGRYAAALAGELSRSIEAIDGVVDARVHVAIPDARGFALDDAPLRPRGSVLVKHRPNRSPIDESAVRALVAGAVEDMRPEDVSVVLVPAPARAPVERALVKVGPVWVARSSATLLRALFAGTAVAGMCLAAGLVILVRRRRRWTGVEEAGA